VVADKKQQEATSKSEGKGKRKKWSKKAEGKKRKGMD
jgi:hypothetical protein